MCGRELYPRVAFAIPNVAHLFIIAPTGFVSSSETQPIDRAFVEDAPPKSAPRPSLIFDVDQLRFRNRRARKR